MLTASMISGNPKCLLGSLEQFNLLNLDPCTLPLEAAASTYEGHSAM